MWLTVPLTFEAGSYSPLAFVHHALFSARLLNKFQQIANLVRPAGAGTCRNACRVSLTYVAHAQEADIAEINSEA